jgi:hypothetical protein
LVETHQLEEGVARPAHADRHRGDRQARAFIDNVVRQGVEHHVALVYGDWTAGLAQFCDFTGLDYLPLASVCRLQD